MTLILPLLMIPLDALFLSCLAIITGAITAIAAWNKYQDTQLEKAKVKAKEESVGAAAIDGQDKKIDGQSKKIDEVLQELKELKSEVKDNAGLRERVNKLDNDFRELLQTSLRYWQERGRL